MSRSKASTAVAERQAPANVVAFPKRRRSRGVGVGAGELVRLPAAVSPPAPQATRVTALTARLLALTTDEQLDLVELALDSMLARRMRT